MFTASHRRLNRLTGEWVLVSPHRTARPWQGQVEEVAADQRPTYDPACYLCPGNGRAGGARTPEYDSTYVFDNDFAALTPDVAPEEDDRKGLLIAQSERGICRVVCFSPRHDLTLGQMPAEAIRTVVDTWADQYLELGSLDWVRHVQIFENRGAMMGASNPHPHGQIWANERLPNEPAKELAQQRARADSGGCLLCDYLDVELNDGERIVTGNEHFTALVPFWAVWPFETLVLPRAHAGALPDLGPDQRDGLADILRRLTRRYDRLFGVTFPYSMGLHQQPTDGDPHREWHLHAHFYPPLLRSATVRKFMVGYELLGQPQRDITPETAAQRLRELPED
ncbi:UTP-hexose-1-phosphate uridylyltransferase /UDP-glucose-hexose-1-phosphate uridylyltransferase [Geodermatophilus amargosae]|uniref:Galactose-1-phosphate uridylyltransferase n=1 Tax=Geodermatophilus amargosae TaxID=1296565 RepID=A0A1I6Z6J3_9ACTN|nr:UDP-glucose--hexose-1-phosphate uridylyltransferase [Geodermatophilus amargosae]SFT58340.1 UTP-hexose-1-phosphate uridylyltransferase /UDP-glucose-hexose-1-phosphate uridylyltransferase [Geodermatophilus amargosae]